MIPSFAIINSSLQALMHATPSYLREVHHLVGSVVDELDGHGAVLYALNVVHSGAVPLGRLAAHRLHQHLLPRLQLIGRAQDAL